MATQVVKGLLGRYSVKYDCPKCKARLTSPLDDAGAADTCPDCGFVFVVPGTAERERLHAERQAAVERQCQAAEQAKIAKANADASKREQEAAQLAERRRRQEEHRKALLHQQAIGGDRRRCPFCAEEILADAKKCKHCGEFLAKDTATTPTPPPKKSKKWIYWGFGFLFLLGIANSGSNSRQSGSKISSNDWLPLINAAQQGIRSILKSPSTASFPSPITNSNAYIVDEHSANSCTVKGYVDAQNGFGAQLRSYWIIDCEKNGRTWIATNPVLLGP